MLRRRAAFVVLAMLAVGLGLPYLSPAHGVGVAGPRAVRLVASDGHRVSGQWQSWANASLVPTVAGQVKVLFSGCPGLPKAAGCVFSLQPRVVYLKTGLMNPRGVMLHELGHVYDMTVLSNRDRGQFRRIMRRPSASWWKGRTSLSEWFAEAYGWCARYSRIDSIRSQAIYGYDPSPAQHRSTCALIKRAARDRTPPAPAAAAPLVTGDPMPPTPPFLVGTVLPDDSTRTSAPVPPAIPTTTSFPAPTTTATPRATPTAPVPTVTAIPTIMLPTRTPTPTATVTNVDPDPDPVDEDPEPTATSEPEPTPDPTEEPEPTEEPTPEPTPNPYRAYPH